ncbi:MULTISPECIES: alpha-L-arabinofuranosidase C-terminal domain-containing protein [unclassified Nocardioides]|uniref:alpha-L-arabinofuranosidase C-terminal domain-containing protein n=1 Tax=unclassified Nocardioides TaxID=2615069 RepID=UPI0006F932FD|nr:MULTISPECIES: alpha-L-arabinofuranosidase C-terminal domain-containing protein [unclassified Nocardioides]KRA38823.1 hypothetical protein ASD81_09575 [Nocardioides sp. Root614]KRA92783.1 hypothetical protein ASD84_09840 [Nocardioides sp. Root682]
MSSVTSPSPRSGRRLLAASGAALALLAGTLAAAAGLGAASPAAAAAPADTPVTWTDAFDGASLDERWDVVNPDPGALEVSGGALRISGQPGDTYQGVNTAKNIVMLDVPAGDFTATATVAAPVSKVYQGAGLIAWQDMDNYVRAGLTYVGALSPSGVAVETDREVGAAFGAVAFADRPASTGETLRLQRTGDTITSSYREAGTGTWVTAATTTVAFDTTQVGLYALAAQDGTPTAAVFDDVEITHAQGADVVPSGTFTLQADRDASYLVTDGDRLALTADQPTSSLRLLAAVLGDGALGIATPAGPLVLDGAAVTIGDPGAEPTPFRITDAGGGKVVLRTEGADGYVVADGDGHLATGAEADAIRFVLTEVEDGTATLDIDADGAGAELNPDMFGIFFEDINYAADGGIYAELVRNRSFEFNGTDNGSFNAMTAWSLANRSGGASSATVVNDAGRLNDLNRNYLQVVAAAAGDGVRNTGFDAVAIKQGAVHDASVWVRTTTPQSLTIAFEDAAGTTMLGSGTVQVLGDGSWHQVEVPVTATATSNNARIAVLAGAPSTLAVDMVSVMPRDTWVGPVNGRSVLRKDLAERVAAMDPGFVRFPGGCVTNVGTFKSYEESGYVDRQRTYQWKETIGPVEERPTNKNFWGYNQTYGIGYLEYFELAEDLGAEPLPVLSVGANGCGSTIPEMKDQASIDRWVQDTLDLIEFANGGVDTEWGAVRAGLGHPEPFDMKMIGLGNEENTTTFEANFPQFKQAVEAAYPDIAIISNSGPDDTGTRFDTLWSFNRAQGVDMVDEHYYNDPDWFLDNNHRYDDYDRSGPKVFLGEYASRGNTFNNALVEAAYMTGLQRNGDVVQLASYAPLLAHENHVQWSPDAIWFDNDESWESADWQVQKMFGNNVGDQVVPSTFDGAVNDAQDVRGGAFLSTWNTSAAYDNVVVTDNETGATLFSDDFADASKWASQQGSWAVNGGRYVQSSTSTTDARSIMTGAYDKGWTNYTLELDATKLSGSEGFLVGFGATGANNFYWWNLGGWNNTRSVLQRADGGNASEVVALEGEGVTTGTTYHLKIEVDGSTIRLFQDGVLKLTYDQVDTSEQLFQVVTKDEKTGDLVAKVVNTATGPVRTQVRVSDAAIEPTGTVTTLTAPSRGATNTKGAPQVIWPKERAVGGLSNDFEYEFPGSSVTFLRMHTADGVAPTVEELTVQGQGVRGWYRDPATVHVEAADNREVDHVEWSLDGGAWQQAAGAEADIEVAGDGSHELTVRAVDTAGNVGEARPLAVGVDAAAPVTKATFDATARTITLTAADTGAGIPAGGTEYRLGDGAWTSYDDPIVVGAQPAVVEFRSTDVFGNAEEPGRLEVPAAGVEAAPSTTAAVAVATRVALGKDVAVRVTVAGASSVPTGTVSLREGATVLATADLVGGKAVLRVPAVRLRVGSHQLVADYAGSATHAGSSDSVRVTVVKAAASTALRITRVATRRPQVTVRVSAAVPVSGAVQVVVQRNGRTVLNRTVSLSGGRGTVRLPRLKRGSYVLLTRYAGSATVGTSSTRSSLRIR